MPCRRSPFLAFAYRQHSFANLKRSSLVELLALEFEAKLQWEENECLQRLNAEELQHDDLVIDLMDQNAEWHAEADSLSKNRTCRKKV